MQDREEQLGLSRLTPREIEIIGLIALGKNHRDIAEALKISHRTVEKHLEASMGKVGALNRAHLVALAISSGLIPPIEFGHLVKEIGSSTTD